jgi:nuclear pore complex protein Nup93
LKEMGELVGKFGERHFDPRGDRPVFWFQVLMFVGEFEKVSREGLFGRHPLSRR